MTSNRRDLEHRAGRPIEPIDLHRGRGPHRLVRPPKLRRLKVRISLRTQLIRRIGKIHRVLDIRRQVHDANPRKSISPLPDHKMVPKSQERRPINVFVMLDDDLSIPRRSSRPQSYDAEVHMARASIGTNKVPFGVTADFVLHPFTAGPHHRGRRVRRDARDQSHFSRGLTPALDQDMRPIPGSFHPDKKALVRLLKNNDGITGFPCIETQYRARALRSIPSYTVHKAAIRRPCQAPFQPRGHRARFPRFEVPHQKLKVLRPIGILQPCDGAVILADHILIEAKVRMALGQGILIQHDLLRCIQATLLSCMNGVGRPFFGTRVVPILSEPHRDGSIVLNDTSEHLFIQRLAEGVPMAQLLLHIGVFRLQ